ncbi:MAG: hypothetical protein JKY37_25795 [Nannocystaceae bacterium]|nr:hypothetical protein [Nannocystaceae bacterium]
MPETVARQFPLRHSRGVRVCEPKVAGLMAVLVALACSGDDAGSTGGADEPTGSSTTGATTATGDPGTATGGDAPQDSSGGAATAADSTSDDAGRDTTVGFETGTSGGEASCGGGSACAETVADWVGPVAIHSKPVAEEVVCAGDFAEVASETMFFGVPSAEHECECSCDVDNGASCGPIEFSVYANSVCFSVTSLVVDLVDGCLDIPGVAATEYVALEVDILGEGCDPNTSGTVIEDVEFLNHVIACEPSQPPQSNAGCDENEVCLEIPVVPFDSTVCLLREGDHVCPDGTEYTERTVYYESIDDDRSCNACTCTLSGAECDPNQVRVFGTNNCSGAPVGVIDNSEVCTDPGAQGFSSILGDGAVADPGNCAAGAGTSNELGSFTPVGPTTVCCLPQ